MSEAYMRNAAGLWIPISAGAGAVPGQVNAQTVTPGDFKSICGLTDPPAETKFIRDITNTEWIPLDEYPVADPPVIIGFTTRTALSNVCRFYHHANAQAGDLILGFGGQRVGDFVSFSSKTATLLWQFQNTNLLAQPFVGAAIHNGSSQYYEISSNEFAQCSSIAITIRGAAAINQLSVGSSTYSPSNQTKSVLNQAVTQNSLSIAGIIEEYINGSPFTYVNGNWQILADYAVGSSSGNDVMVASYVPGADGSSGTGKFTGASSSNSGYTSQVIGVPPA